MHIHINLLPIGNRVANRTYVVLFLLNFENFPPNFRSPIHGFFEFDIQWNNATNEVQQDENWKKIHNREREMKKDRERESEMVQFYRKENCQFDVIAIQ